ncbi:MAG: efflux RND transporter periplasmic adaptor subunit [Bacteroidia bacterium]
MQRYWKPAVSVLALGAVLLLAACEPETREEALVAFSLSDTMLARCAFEPARQEEVKNELRLFGKIVADNNKTAQVYPVVGGVVTSIRIELGDYVRQGQVLATIQSSEVAQFRKEKLDAVNAVAIAEKNLQVAQDLFAGRLNSEKDVAIAEKELENARTELARIDDIYKIYSLQDGSVYQVVAPISGFVIAKRINQNEQIRSDITDPLFAIADINEVWALANVNESDIAQVKVGYEATVQTLAFADQVYTGRIDKIFNAIDTETRAMKARIRIPNGDLRLKPEMNCTVSLHFTEDRQMVAVPTTSVIFDKSKYWVMVFTDRDHIETRQVQVYRQLGDRTYLSSGVAAGETVISRSSLLVYDAIND